VSEKDVLNRFKHVNTPSKYYRFGRKLNLYFFHTDISPIPPLSSKCAKFDLDFSTPLAFDRPSFRKEESEILSNMHVRADNRSMSSPNVVHSVRSL